MDFEKNIFSEKFSPGFRHYRSFVGPPTLYDILGALQFNLLIFLGLREYHFLLDIGCGSLRAGRLFIPYLLPGHYFGVEPEKWLVKEGIKNELGEDIIKIKKPVFSYDENFNFSVFNKKFDFILASSVFTHTSKWQIEKCLFEAKKIMKPNSIFCATFYEGNKNYKGKKWLKYPSLAVYTLDFMKEIIKNQGLNCNLIEWFHPLGQKWIIITMPENKINIPVSKLPDLDNTQKILQLENQLKLCYFKLLTLEKHPYVKIGLKIYRIIKSFFKKIKQIKLFIIKLIRSN